MGTRLRPLTLTTPKSLVKVKGIPILEKQIEFLKDKGIDEIIVVVGYLSEKFEYLQAKYGVKLVYNDKYDIYNNLYTMYLVRDYLPDSYVLEGDVFLNRNFLKEKPDTSLYFSGKKKNFNNEWILRFDQQNRIYDIEIGNGEQDFILCGVSYWSEKDGLYISKKMEEVMSKNDYASLYWDDIVKDNLQELNVYLYKINNEDSYEIDSVEELEQVNKILNEE
jgi:CTP:phosphocholine cytidylyltransferase-like protein